LMEGEVKEGEIISPCVWKANKNLIVVKWKDEPKFNSRSQWFWHYSHARYT
jgi:hypothetical protein